MYQFRSDDGDIIERNYPMAEAPDLGFAVVEKGKTYKRILSVDIQIEKEFKPYESIACTRGVEKFDSSIKVNKKTGRPIISSRAQEKAVAKQLGLEWK